MPQKKQTILIVEDEEALRNVFADGLKKAGYTICTAENGEEGLSVALKEHPDLILLDVIMPKVDGFGLLEGLRKDAWGKEAKVILLTNVNESDLIARAFEFGVQDYLVKNEWSIEQLVTKVEDKLKA